MKYKGEVIEVVTQGDDVKVVLQCKQRGAAEWRRMARVRFDVRPHEAEKFHVGRAVSVTVKPL